MKYFIVAGEASGDLHASNLVKALKLKDPNAVIYGWGGDLMEQEGVVIKKHYKDLAFMGFIEVISNLKTILGNFKLIQEQIQEIDPDRVIMVDYPGFNLRLAEKLKKAKFKGVINYYISPQIWAWKESRVKKIKKYVDQVLCILPFEKAFYAKHQMDVSYVGHPLLDAVQNYSVKSWFYQGEKKVIALLPGSRNQEIKTLLPIILKGVKQFENDFHLVIAGAPSKTKAFYDEIIQSCNYSGAYEIVMNKTYDVLAQAHLAVVTSGTATLETALFNVPECVVYKGSNISYQIAKRLIKVDYISLVNLILDAPVVKELIQNECTPKNIAHQVEILNEGPARNKMLADYAHLKNDLGNGTASSQAAALIYEFN